MNVVKYIEEFCGAKGEYPFAGDPSTCVFRHQANRKWFAVIMEIPREKLGIPGEEKIRVINLKCDTRMIGVFRQESGSYPGYHMHKAHWLTVLLDGTVGDDKIKFLIDMSYDLTKKQTKVKEKKNMPIRRLSRRKK